MIVHVPSLLDAAQLAAVRERLAAADWGDGRATAGHQSAQVKHNLQLPAGSAVAHELGELIVRALERSELFVSAALPRHVYPPLFNRYEGGMHFGAHVDNAVRQIPGKHHRLRTDLSATLFLSPAQDYDGGDLIIEDTFGSQRIRLPAGDLVLYPASSLHRVTPVTRGTRLAAVFWVQSMVREDAERRLLFEMDWAIRQLAEVTSSHSAIVQLTGCYHNLLRRWGEL